jgi:hypothetical protein
VESLTYAYDHAPRRQRVVELDRGHVDGHGKAHVCEPVATTTSPSQTSW